MKTIGLLAGMSWESSIEYYRSLNQGVRERLGGLHSAKILMHSIDFAPMAIQQQENDWQAAGQVLADAAFKLQGAGADCMLIGTNTMHKVADQIEAAIDIPLLHIADATGAMIQSAGQQRVVFLGTRFAMQGDFITKRIEERFDIKVLVPDSEAQEVVHRIIFEELCLGEIRQDSRDQILAILDRFAQQGTHGVILGCTELGLIIKPEHTELRIFDSMHAHVRHALDWAMAE